MHLSFGSLLIIGSSALTALAHTQIRNLVVNNSPLDIGDHIVGYPNNTVSPVRNSLSSEMNCRMPSLTSDLINNADPFSVKSGDDVMIEWRYGTSLSSPVIEEHHIGPCLFYMASVPKGNATPQWFKIAQDGYSNDQWCVSKLIANNGIQNVTIPENLKAGNYLLRAEVIGLQLAGELYGTSTTAGAQFYMNCVHLTVTGNGKVVPSGEGLFSFPSDTYLATSPGIYYKETDPTKYQFPGPAVYEF